MCGLLGFMKSVEKRQEISKVKEVPLLQRMNVLKIDAGRRGLHQATTEERREDVDLVVFGGDRIERAVSKATGLLWRAPSTSRGKYHPLKLSMKHDPTIFKSQQQQNKILR
jgi:hypothetical protein